MDKTDMLYGPRDYLRRASLAAPAGSDSTKTREGVREMNKGFAKLDKPRDRKFSSHGGGVVYEPNKGLSQRQYETLALGRVLTFSGKGVGECEIVTGYVPKARKVNPSRAKLARSPFAR